MTSPKRRSSPPRAKGLLEALEMSFQDALRTPEGTAEPVALLWADTDRQWADLITRLRAVLPHVFTLGAFNATERTGPAIWLRCVVDGVLPDVKLPSGTVPTLYLPGVPRQSLRAGEDCPRELQPLVELQYRGRVWHQRNGRDWTVEAFLVSEDGLGLDVAQDTKTRDASVRALSLLAEAPIEGLRGHRLDADDFDRLAVSDPIRDLLRWMSVGDGVRTATHDNQWRAFCSVCRSEFQFDPDKSAPQVTLPAKSSLAAGSGMLSGSASVRPRSSIPGYPSSCGATRPPCCKGMANATLVETTKPSLYYGRLFKRSPRSRMRMRSRRSGSSRQTTDLGANGSGLSSARALWRARSSPSLA